MTVYAPHFIKVADRTWVMETVDVYLPPHKKPWHTYKAEWHKNPADIIIKLLQPYGNAYMTGRKGELTYTYDDPKHLYKIRIDFDNDADEAVFILIVPDMRFSVGREW